MFDKIVNPAFLDILDCPYLNYVKAPTELDRVSGYIDGEDGWNALPENSKREYIKTLSKMVKNDSSESDEINKKNMVENYPNKDNKWGTNTIIFMIILIVAVNLIMWFVLNNKN